MDLDVAIGFPYCRFALRLWCDDEVEQIAEFATRALRVAVNKVTNDLESDVQNLVDPPNALRPVDAGPHDAWTTRSLELTGALKGHHIWTLALDVTAPPHVDEDTLAEKLRYYRTFLQERLENQAEAMHLWRSPATPPFTALG
jgi:hypothetical protein